MTTRPYIIVDICTHPKGILPTCACGENRACPDCGYGMGMYPCKCTPKVKAIVQKYSKQFNSAWEELAK